MYACMIEHVMNYMHQNGNYCSSRTSGVKLHLYIACVFIKMSAETDCCLLPLDKQNQNEKASGVPVCACVH